MRKLRVVAKTQTKVIALVNLTSHIGQQIRISYRQALEILVLWTSQQADLATGRGRRLTTSSAMQIPKRV